MRLLKKINNNFALAVDSKQSTVIVEGRGIGFLKMPCDIADLSKISHTYYSASKQDMILLKNIPESILEISSIVADKAMREIGNLNSNLTFILADHIQFAIERKEKNIDFNYPIRYDIQKLFPKESEIAQYMLSLIEKRIGIILDQSESTGIALNIINAEAKGTTPEKNADRIIQMCVGIIEKEMNIHIDQNTFNYSRFVSHFQYIIQKQKNKLHTSSDNERLYEKVSEQYSKVSECVDIMASKLSELGYILDKEEKLYLILHVNRLCGREDCNRI